MPQPASPAIASSATPRTATPDFTERQGDVLACALKLLVEGGEKAMTTAGIARAANCSKESLYKWFGDRDGLLAAVITYQAAKVRTPGAAEERPDAETYRARLETFAADLLSVLCGDVSLALNRLAIGQASRSDALLGRLLIDRGRRAIHDRALALLNTGRSLGYLTFEDTEEAYQTLYGLIVRDLHVRALLGEIPANADDGAGYPAQAARAVNQFYRLFGT